MQKLQWVKGLSQFAAMLPLLFAGPMLWAQNAQISGRVTDSSSALVVGAEVAVVNTATGVRLKAQSNGDGYFTVGHLEPGEFQVEVRHEGFKPVLRSGIVLQVDESARLDFTLEPGAVTERIVIEAAVPLVESETSDLGQVVNNKSIVEMPINGRSVWDLSKIAGGMVYVTAGGDAGEVPAVSIAGSRTYSQAYMLDGGSVQKSGLARSQSELSPMVDAVSEFKIITNNYAAEYGRSAGGVFTAVTKTGTNQLHGNAFEFFRNDCLDARNFYAITTSPLRYNQFGGTIGGPIKKNKAFFFAAIETSKVNKSTTVLLTVPTPEQRRGDFSKLVNAQGRAVPLYNPFSVNAAGARDPLPGNIVPASLMDPVGVKLVSFYPDPNQPGNLAGANNENVQAAAKRTQYHGTMRVDYNLSNLDRVFARYVAQNNTTPQASVYPEPAASGLGPVTRNIANMAHTYMVSWVRTLSTTLLNDLKWSGTNQDRQIAHASIGGDWPSKLGLKGVGEEAFPRIVPGGGYSALGPVQPYRAQTNPYWHVSDSLSWFRGNHAVKAGYEYRHNRTTDWFDTNPTGLFTIPIAGTGIVGNANTGNGIAALLIGYASQVQLIRSTDYRFHSWSMGWYIQDDWKVTPRLTLNLGVRYDIETGRTEDENKQSSFDMTKINPVAKVPGVVTFAGVNGVPRTNFDMDKNNVAPRFGFAWRPLGNNDTVVRGGFGLFFSNPNDQGFNQDAVLGFATNVLLVGANQESSVMLLRNGFTGANAPTAADRNDGFGINGPAEFFERERGTPYSMQYNLGVQHAVRGVLVSAQYLANLSRKLVGNPMSINQIRPERLREAGTQQSRRPFPQFSDVTVQWPTLGASTYHALLLKTEKRYHNGLQFVLNYTFSKFIDNVDPIADFGGTPGFGYSDLYNRRADKSMSPSDLKHLVSYNVIYDLPWGARRRWLTRGLASQILGGWQLSSLGVIRSGAPFGVQTQTNTCNCFSAGPQRPDLLRDPNLPEDQRSIGRWFDTEAFAQPAAYTFGNAARAVGRAPGAFTIDMALNKNFIIRERFRLQFRSEYFNVLNHPNFGMPGLTMNSSTFGAISSAADGRVMQLALKFYF